MCGSGRLQHVEKIREGGNAVFDNIAACVRILSSLLFEALVATFWF